MPKPCASPRLVAALAAALALAAGCGPAPSDPEGSKEAARIGGDSITVAELDARIKDDLFDQETDGRDPAKLYELRTEKLDELIDERLLEDEAKARGMSADDLAKLEESKARPVEQAEIQAFYDQVKARLGGAKLEAVADQIRRRLDAQRRFQARSDFVEGLREKAQVTVSLEPPRIPVEASGPSVGPSAAPVTIVEFSDFQCPFCKRAVATVNEIAKRYPDQVRIVFRHFPLDGHALARPAAEASACADAQGKFWPYHDLLFESSPELGQERLRELAGKSSLDLAAFDACLADGRLRARVEQDLAAGREAGVSGTPAFFVNGIPLSGARSVDEFVELIERELARPETS
jgi:protein-disulfide isomerase